VLFSRRFPYRITLAVMLLLLCCTVLPVRGGSQQQTASGAPVLAAPQASSPFGVAGVMRWPVWGTFNQPADLMLQTGGAWVRDDFVWGLIQPKPDEWNWTATDRIVAELGNRKLNMLGVIAYSVSWATPTNADDGSAMSFYPPDPDAYYTFVRTLVGRYKNVVHHWEVWNEPDNGTFWKPAPNASEYAALLKVAYRAVKDADPTAKVVTGGVSGNAVPYLEEMLAAGAAGSFDILAIHPYAVPLDPAQGKIQSRPEVHKILDVELAKYRAFLGRHKLDRPVWVTELGWPAQDWGLQDNEQADYLSQAFALMLSSGLTERIFAYSFKDQSNKPGDSWGLVAWGNNATDLNPKRVAFSAYATSARLLTGTSPGGRVQLSPVNVAVDFEGGGAWSRSMHGDGTLISTTERKHGGASTGKLSYNLPAQNMAVDFAPPAPVTLPGKPTRMGIWALGDGSGDYLSAWLRDKDGELFKVRLGAIMGEGDGWRYYESPINNYYFDWEKAGGSPANGTPDYPLTFVSFRLENTPDEPAGSGVIYLDDLQTWEGPDVSSVRFNRSDGSVVDVLWSVNPTQASVPTGSGHVQIFSRDGAESSVESKNGAATVNVSASPIYLVHTPHKDSPKMTAPLQPNGGFTELCPATQRASDLSAPGNTFYAETGHNLSEPFKSYWRTHGGVDILGFPITEVFEGKLADGKSYKQQYFERARLEYHPENAPPADVQLGLLGVWAAEKNGATNLVHAQAAPGGVFFPETGQTLNLFNAWWNSNGGLSLFGFPITPEIQERNDADGKTYTVQYFERNRLESHPEYAGSRQEVLLGLLGVEYVAAQGCK
jgi:hypothetical protein